MPPVLFQLLFAATIFSSAFLLFLVQPLIAKQILPWFGGSAAVWSICMVFFQVLLLAGYAYADWLTRRPARVQAVLHSVLLLGSLAFMPIVAAAHWKPSGSEDPMLWILGLLLGTIGLPYFLLSTTGPLVQSWLARTPWGAQVYRYFSLSNLASLVSLLAYPVLIEPYSALRPQALGWSWGYAGFVLLCGVASAYAAGLAPAAAQPVAHLDHPDRLDRPTDAAPGWRTYGVWLALPGLATWLLLAVTNHITQNVASVPFLWVLPLSVYLLSFVFTFENDRWYRRSLLRPAAGVALLLCAYGLQHDIGYGLASGVPLYVVGLFVLCMFLHGEMAALRPSHGYLTRFYLLLSLGGALGGISVGLVAPHVLPAYYELGLGLVLVALLGAVVLRRQRVPLGVCLLLALACGYLAWQQVRSEQDGTRRMARNFYGTLASLDSVDAADPSRSVRQLYHGSVKHGEQYLDPARRREPTAYYGTTSGVGRALLSIPSLAPATPRRIGLIGLGAGTLATYGQAGDVVRVYEINPQVFDFADTEFSFLQDSPAQIERVLGDARLALEREPPQQFDVLAVDAFSGDSVPIHLVTAEAMQVYVRHLRPDGVVAFHVTNRFLNLAPVVEKIARTQGLQLAFVHDEAENSDLRRTDWVLVSPSAPRLQVPQVHSAASAITPIPGLRLWTDDFNNLFGVLK